MKDQSKFWDLSFVFVVLTLATFIAFPYYLLEPMQTLYANNKDAAPVGKFILISIAWGVLVAFFSHSWFILRVVKDDGTGQINFGSFLKASFWIWAGIWILAGILITIAWLSGL